MQKQNKKWIVYLLLVFIIALGFFVRVWKIQEIPPGIYPDEAVNGMDALKALRSWDFQWFYTDNNGREGLFINFISFSFAFLGVNILALKLPSILLGILTIWGIFLLGREFWKNDRLALLAAYLASVSFWSINFSRISFRAILLPAILTFSFYFLWKGLRNEKFWPFIFGGLIFGLGMHSYIAFRIAPLILTAIFIFLWIGQKGFFQKFWKQALVFLFCAFLTALPMFYTFWAHPEFLSSRSGSISILSPEVNQGNLTSTFLKTFGLSLAKYNFWGDQNWRHNFPPYPILNPLVGIAFLVGLVLNFALFTKSLIQKFLKKKEITLEKAAPAFLIFWFFSMLVPEFMTAEGLPHALRAIGTLPAVYIFSAWTIEIIWKKGETKSALIKKNTTILMIFFLIFIAFLNITKYQIWGQKMETARSFEKTLLDISRYIEKNPNFKTIIITGNMQRIPIKLFHYQNSLISYYHPDEANLISKKEAVNSRIILTEKNEEIIKRLMSLDNFKIEEKEDEFGLKFWIMY